MFLIKRKDNSYVPSDDASVEASKKIAVGEEVKATQARNVHFHRKGFALLNLGFSNQDKYEQLEVYRKVITIKAGFFDEVEGKDGHPYYFPKSISFDKMNAEEFEKWYKATLAVISTQLQTKPEEIQAELNSYY